MMGSKSGLIESTQINNNWHSLSNGKNVAGNFFLTGVVVPHSPHDLQSRHKSGNGRHVSD